MERIAVNSNHIPRPITARDPILTDSQPAMILDRLDPRRNHNAGSNNYSNHTVTLDNFEKKVAFNENLNTTLSHRDEEAAGCDDEHCIEETWDEGGKSDCGYSDSVHDTLMSIGKLVHSFFGEPSDEVQVHMRSVGSYFQEASYIVRDMSRGASIEDCDYSYRDLEYGYLDSIEQEAFD